jgi:hypothetical protein
MFCHALATSCQKDRRQQNHSAHLPSYRTAPPFLPNPLCHRIKEQIQAACQYLIKVEILI